MDILTILRQDYARFPIDQSYDIYAEDVYFQDPLNRFRGVKRYRQMISFIEKWFEHPTFELYALDRVDRAITTRWALSWNTPLPWKPRITISGKSELVVNESELIVSHIDYWDCSPFDVVKQHFRG
ncbi:DUF2358 domain-containing protein [Chamaesiphon sp. OTE_8_metabat_110]|uniref:DUF2358 domain-containing protein n=1 Tax=Chamaesiphon sp. OTE_8_metabat_110 TaxID=2964696 RepID=UPI00286B329A|nr:DUF2358 domain-containing protein [Chamaesiphon sp. OTE_8_metabat_110]